MKNLRRALYLLLGVAFAAVITLAYADHSVRHDTVVTVHKIYSGMESRSCSAVVIAPGRAMTAAHCADLLEPVMIIGDVQYPYTVTAISTESPDLAILNVPGVSCPCAPLSSEAVQEGDKIIVIGFPFGLLRVVTYGEVQGRLMREEGQIGGLRPGRYVVAAANAAPGNSGGGVFNEKGELVGVASGAAAHVFLFSETPTVR